MAEDLNKEDNAAQNAGLGAAAAATGEVVEGTSEADDIQTGDGNDEINAGAGGDTAHSGDGHDAIDGESGDDTLDGGTGDDLVAAGNAGAEWVYVNGQWVYDATKVNTAYDAHWKVETNDNTLIGDTGRDVLLGAGGRDLMHGGEGNDLANGGGGQDRGYGCDGNDKLNLEGGSDYGDGGAGNDTLKGGAGDGVLFGDTGNLLATSADQGAGTFSQYASQGNWIVHEGDQELPWLSQTLETAICETSELNFDLAANLGAGVTNGTVEVGWDGELLDTVSVESGVLTSFSLSLDGTGAPEQLEFRNVPSDGQTSGPEVNMDGPIMSYDKSVEIGGAEVEVAAFYPGQAKLYQVINVI